MIRHSASRPASAHERDERVVDLRDTAAERRGREVDDALALERLRKPADLVHQTTSRNRGVVGKRLVSGVDELEHGLGALSNGRTVARDTARAASSAFSKRSRDPLPPARAPISSAVGDRTDDRDAGARPQTARLATLRPPRRIEPFALVDHLDYEPVRQQQVGDLDDAGVLTLRMRAGPSWTQLR